MDFVGHTARLTRQLLPFAEIRRAVGGFTSESFGLLRRLSGKFSIENLNRHGENATRNFTAFHRLPLVEHGEIVGIFRFLEIQKMRFRRYALVYEHLEREFVVDVGELWREELQKGPKHRR